MRPRFLTLAVAALLLIGATTRAVAQRDSLAAALVRTFGGDTTGRARLSALLQPYGQGIPRSPAFELLPEQPSEVTHLVTAHDFQANAMSWYEGGTVKTGIAVDSRPLTRVGSLAEYQRDWWRRVVFSTILSAGTARATSDSRNVLGALGIHSTLVDRGDPRMSMPHLDSLARLINRELRSRPAPPLGANPDSARLAAASAVADSLRAAWRRSKANAMLIQVGAAGSATSASGATSPDSVTSTAGGAWLAGRIPLGTAHLSLAGKGRWSRAVADTQETRRLSAGGRLLIPVTDGLTLSGESSWIAADHRNASALNDRWWHLAAVVEWYVPELKGWLGAGYGGDRQRSAGPKNQFALQYAFYSDRLLAP